MNILVTGAKGFIGKNLVENLKNIRDEKNQTRPDIHIGEIYEYGRESSEGELEEYCRKADFIFNFAGVNRPKVQTDFKKVNSDFVSELIDMLKKHHNTCPIMQSSSIQAELTGRFSNSEYGISKKSAEDILFRYAEECGAKVLIYRFPNVFGKWCKPDYNSVVATFCNNIASDKPIKIDNPDTELELLYIDDLVEEMLDALEGREHINGKFCHVPTVYHETLGHTAELIRSFRTMPETNVITEIPAKSFQKKLYSTYISYLPERTISYPLEMNVDNRGIFTELFKSDNVGQVSINVARPGIVRGEHWHNSKWEIFVVVSGHGLIQERKIGSDEIIEFEVDGEHMRAVQILPGYTHNIINLSDTENLVTVMWANEPFDKSHPDTFYEKVEE